jgi:methylamine dehydrogenase heavy chain
MPACREIYSPCQPATQCEPDTVSTSDQDNVNTLRTYSSAALLLCIAWSLAHPASAPLPPETATVKDLPPVDRRRVYIVDVAIMHPVDGKLHIVDGDSLRYLGQVSTAAAGTVQLAPDGSEIYVATTYFPRLGRGPREEEVDIYDAVTLRFKAQIPLPAKKSLSIPYDSLSAISADGRWLFVQNVTPASSISVIDLRSRQFVHEISTPGCYAVYSVPSAPSRLATLCGDGTLANFTLDADGAVADQSRSAKFFDADKDPVFITAGHAGDRFYFVSFLGVVHPVNLSDAQVSIEHPWSLVEPTDRPGGWRPGGYQLMAVQSARGRFYVGMHSQGSEGSHKNPAEEIWTFDLATHKRLIRTPTTGPVVAIQVSQDEKPALFAIDGEKNAVLEFDASSDLKLVRRVDALGGETALALVVR